LNPQPP